MFKNSNVLCLINIGSIIYHSTHLDADYQYVKIFEKIILKKDFFKFFYILT